MRYLPKSPAERVQMLAEIGAASIDDLFSIIPAEYRLTRDLDVPRQQAGVDVIAAADAVADVEVDGARLRQSAAPQGEESDEQSDLHRASHSLTSWLKRSGAFDITQWPVSNATTWLPGLAASFSAHAGE